MVISDITNAVDHVIRGNRMRVLRPNQAARPLTAAILLIAVTLAACQTDDDAPVIMSLEDARRVSTEFEGTLFIPPARTINDIVKQIGDVKADFKNCTEDYIKTIQAEMRVKPPRPSWHDDGPSFARIRSLMRTADDGFILGLQKDSISLISAIKKQLWGRMYRFSRGGVSYVLARHYAAFGNLDAAKDAVWDGASAFGANRNYYFQYSKPYHESHEFIGQAAVASANGEYLEAEKLYRQALKSQEDWWRATGRWKRETYVRRIFIMSDLAEVLARQGRLSEAEAELRKALSDAYQNSIQIAYLLGRLGHILFLQGRFEEAEWLGRQSINTFLNNCVTAGSVYLAQARQRLAEAMLAQGRSTEALEIFERIGRDLKPKEPDLFKRLFEYNPDWALALLDTGKAGDAIKVLQTAISRIDANREREFEKAELRGLLGIALWRTQQPKKALANFREAVPILLKEMRQNQSNSSTRIIHSRRFIRILEAYIDILMTGEGAYEDAFELVEYLSSRKVQQALSAFDARTAARDPRLAELVRRTQDLQNKTEAYNALLAYQFSLPNADQDVDVLTKLKSQINRLRDATGILNEEIKSGFPEYAEFTNPKPMTVAETRAMLRSHEALILMYVGEERTYVWAIPKEGSVAFAAADIGREDLTDTVASLRADLEPNARTLSDIPPFDLETAHGLFTKLLRPVQAGWSKANSLLVVAHGPLGYLPLSLLPTEPSKLGPESGPLFANYRKVPWLARTHAVTIMPSVTSLRTLRDLPAEDAKRKPFAGFGDPWFSKAQATEAAKPAPKYMAAVATRGLPVRFRAAPRTQNVDSAELALLPPLPETADEVRSIAVALNADLAKSVFLGKNASEDRVKNMDLSGFKVIAFATHGLVPGDLNGLTQPALALSSPRVVGGKGDGLLTMGEILGLKLNADWVVLSACNTGSGEGAGAEAVSGLGRAFFYAGTRALLVSNWPVETTSAKALTTELFRRQAENFTLSRAEALRQTMVRLIDGEGYMEPKSGKVVFSYAHPLFWAAFTLVGDGRGIRPAS